MLMDFRYFRGLASDMGVLPDIRTCSLCGQPGRCFSLGGVISRELTEAERQGKTGCVSCLRQDRFGFGHLTEVGYITKDGLESYGEIESKPARIFLVSNDGDTSAALLPTLPKPRVSDEAVTELRRTPRYTTSEDVIWQVHCDDFMAYLGIWAPEDFERIAGPGSGRDLFVEMVGANGLWPEGKVPLFGDDIVVFECQHCLKKIGIPDFD